MKFLLYISFNILVKTICICMRWADHTASCYFTNSLIWFAKTNIIFGIKINSLQITLLICFKYPVTQTFFALLITPLLRNSSNFSKFSSSIHVALKLFSAESFILSFRKFDVIISTGKNNLN